jgi:hypothetical protein
MRTALVSSGAHDVPTQHGWVHEYNRFRRVGDTLQFEQQFGPEDAKSLLGAAFDVDGRGLIIGNPTAQGLVPFAYSGYAGVYQVPSP